MKNIKGIIVLFLILSCNSNKGKKAYEDFSNKYYAKIEMTEEGATGDSTYLLYDFNEPSKLVEIGTMKDGFRNGVWTYTHGSGDMFKWGHYKDQYLNFETNLFLESDSIRYINPFTKFFYSSPDDTIIVSVGVNSPVKDSLKNKNFKDLLEDELAKLEMQLIYLRSKKIANGGNEIYYSDSKIKIPSTNGSKLVQDAYCFLDKDLFVEITVAHTNEKNIASRILFNGIMTNFFIDGKRLYDPFMPSSVSYPNWSPKPTK